MCDRMGFLEKDLFKSFMYYVLLVLNVQPRHLVPAATKQKIQASLSTAPRLHTAIAQKGPLTSDAPILLDFPAGVRSQHAAGMYAEVFGQYVQATVPQIASWLLAVCVFRYLGTITFMTDVFFGTPGVREFLGRGLAADTDVSVLLELLTRNFKLRSAFSSFLNPGDGKRPSHPKKMVVPYVTPNGRLLDHLLAALPMWVGPLARAAEKVVAFISAVESRNLEEACNTIQSTMETLLPLALIGNSRCNYAFAFESKVHCYRLTFVLSDIFALVQKLLCENATTARDRRRAGCACSVCNLIYRVRLEFQFVGPAPRNLHCALDRVRCGDPNKIQTTLTMLRNLLREINACWTCKLDLYAIELLPCNWLRFLRLVRRCEGLAKKRKTNEQDVATEIETGNFTWSTHFRTMSGSVAARETLDIKRLFHILRQHNLEDSFFGLNLAEQRSVAKKLLDPVFWCEKLSQDRQKQIVAHMIESA